MRNLEASVLVAKKWNIDSMQRAEMSLQSRNPSAYAIGSHIFVIEALDPPAQFNQVSQNMKLTATAQHGPNGKLSAQQLCNP